MQLVHVPYRNIAQYTPDFIAGQVPLGFQFLTNVIGMLQSGDARALAVTSPKRMTALPDVPTAAEAGVKDYETFGWLALLGPAGMPKPMVDKLYKALEEAVNDPAVRSRFVEQGAEPVSPGPEELQKFIASETAKWKADHPEGRDRADVSERAAPRMTIRDRVLIAGAGPVGMVAAANLVRHGVPVTVLEANADLSDESRASTFHPPTLDMLDAPRRRRSR